MRAPAVGLAVALAGCAPVHSETRVERGATLRSFEREGPASPGGIEAAAEARWPKLSLRFSRYELCKNERVEEYVEERITEVTSPAAGPAIGTGVTSTLIGAGLWLGSGLFSNQPNTRYIDATGRYGPTDRQLAQGWGTVFLVVGVPALATAIVGLVQSGEHVETKKAEAVVSAVEAHCRQQPASGAVTAGRSAPVAVSGGVWELSPEDASLLELSALTFEGNDVEVSAEAQALVEAFRACARSLPAPAAEALGQMKATDIAAKVEDARTCRRVPDAPADEAVAAYEKELETRRDRGETGAGPRVESFEQALEIYGPQDRFEGGSADLEKLRNPEQHVGTAALVRGVLQGWVEPNIALVDVGPRRVWMLVESGSRREPLEAGTRIEAIAVVAGRQQLGALDLPLLRAIWIRRGM
jgi:hypothetical protein